MIGVECLYLLTIHHSQLTLQRHITLNTTLANVCLLSLIIFIGVYISSISFSITKNYAAYIPLLKRFTIISNFCPVVVRLLSASECRYPPGMRLISFLKNGPALHFMKKKNWLLIIIILFAALLIVTVIWIYGKKIEHIESKMKVSTISMRAASQQTSR